MLKLVIQKLRLCRALRLKKERAPKRTYIYRVGLTDFIHRYKIALLPKMDAKAAYSGRQKVVR